MKQHITEAELNELLTETRDKLWNWFENNGYKPFSRDYKPNPNIGMMIEFLGDNWWVSINRLNPEFLCDDLWEAVKDRLDKM